MIRLLRHDASGHFHNGPRNRAGEPDSVADSKTSQKSPEPACPEEISALEIVKSAKLQDCDWAHMLRQWQDAEGQSQAA